MGTSLRENHNDDSKESLRVQGTLERVMFHNEENGYTVMRFVPEGKGQDSITVVGHMEKPQPGGSFILDGTWIQHPRFGRQFQMTNYEAVLPNTEEGIRLYLGSGLIKGIGKRTAALIVERFGEGALTVLDETPQKLLEIKGITPKKLEGIITCWQEHQGIRDLMLFLQPHGISVAYAVRIYRHYGVQALGVVRENPYVLAMDIHGIGFATADAFAEKLGFEPTHPLRAQAGTLYTLMRLVDRGSVYVPQEVLVQQTVEQLHIDPELVVDAIALLVREERVVLEELSDHVGIYLSRYHHYESKIAYYITRLLHSPKSVSFEKPKETVAEVVEKLGIELAEEQRKAVDTSTTAKLMILTGGPGTGKTTIINAIIQVYKTRKAKVMLAAPTGRAAKRMAEASGMEARTLHRLLEYSPGEDGFARNEDNPLACGLLVVDEASMMDTMLAYHLLKAIPLGATVVFVGDVHQLPSVGPGNVLGDFITSGLMPVVQLHEVFRQAAASEIICHAHMINRGEVPPIESSKERLSDFYFMRQSDPEKAADTIVDLVKNHIPRRFGLDAVDDIQVLTPMHKGAVGAMQLNTKLQQALNPQTKIVQRGDRHYGLHDKVMQIRNNYDKDVFNGDIGRVVHVDVEERSLSIRFDERVVPYVFEELDDIVPAYAISIHKSQGSEYPAVVIPIMMQHYMLLQRNLIYTGVTRGKQLVVLVGEGRAFAMAVQNNTTQKRYTYLAERLNGAK